jgi:AmmeMemoRadiSam system protein B/AmmeMemoRadiSam system protein A
MVDGFLALVEPVDGEPIGLIVPHAGYAYSGPVAAYGFRQLEGVEYDVAVVIGSDHRAPLSDPISVWAEGGFETPLGVAPVDAELAQALVEADPRITFDPATHEGEHPIEIELPFLQRVCPDCSIVPVLMGTDDEETVRALADALLELLPGRDVVIVASSDLSHYPTYDDARAVDGATLAAIETGDPGRVRERIEETMASGFPNLATCACGAGPILATMRVAAGLGADTVTVLRYANSGDVSGDHSQVVGYGAVMLWRYEPPDLTERQREELLTLAHMAIEAYVEDGATPAYETEDPILNRRSGVFVTLKEKGELRGCIGHTWADQPLYQAVQRMAVEAATNDPRFSPLTPEELDDVTVEASILSPFRRVTDLEQIQVGVHGLMIFEGGRQGLLLPQVPVEQGWNRERFLDELCLKAGLPEACWQEGATIYAFTAVVFGEE